MIGTAGMFAATRTSKSPNHTLTSAATSTARTTLIPMADGYTYRPMVGSGRRGSRSAGLPTGMDAGHGSTTTGGHGSATILGVGLRIITAAGSIALPLAGAGGLERFTPAITGVRVS